MRDVMAFVYGLIIGSFLNVCIYRLPRDISIVWPGSACPGCSKKIAWYDNIPVLSFLILAARCRHCKTRISPRYPLVEVAGGVVVWAAIHVWGFTAYGIAGAALFCAFIAIALIDFEHEIIPDEISLSGIVAGAVFSLFFPLWQGATTPLGGLAWSVVGILTGGGILFALGTVGEWVFKKEAMGGGDVKLMAALGAFLGWKGVLLTLFLASLFGAVVGLAMRMFTGKERIPFGPYIVAGAALYMLWGEIIIAWYFRAVLRY